MIDLVKALSKLIEGSGEKISFNGLELEFPYDQAITDLFKSEGLSIKVEGNLCSFNLPANSIDQHYFFFDEDDFLKRYDHISNFDESNIFVLTTSNSHYWSKSINEPFKNSMALVFNFHYYRQILSFLLSSTDFISYSIEEKHEFILLDAQGPTEVIYNPLEKRIAQLNDLNPVLKRLREMFEKYEFQEFFKEAILLSIKREKPTDRFFKLVESLPVFLDQAEKDYKIFLKKFAFDKITSRFKEERIKYFQSIEKNIDSINKQVTAFPLTFSATIFASYQVKEKPFILLFVLLAYALYSVVAWMVLNVSLNNLKGLKLDIDKESRSIMDTDTNLYKSFQGDFKQVYKKLKDLFTLVFFLRFVLIILLLLFIAFVGYQIWFRMPNNPLKEILVYL